MRKCHYVVFTTRFRLTWLSAVIFIIVLLSNVKMCCNKGNIF